MAAVRFGREENRREVYFNKTRSKNGFLSGKNKIGIARQKFVARRDIALPSPAERFSTRAVQFSIECNKKIRIECKFTKGLVCDVTGALRRTRFDMRQSAMVAIHAIRSKTGLHRARSARERGSRHRVGAHRASVCALIAHHPVHLRGFFSAGTISSRITAQ